MMIIDKFGDYKKSDFISNKTDLINIVAVNTVTLFVALIYGWNLGNLVVVWWWQSLIIGFYYFSIFRKIPLSYFEDFLKENPKQAIKSPEKLRNHNAVGYLLHYYFVLFIMWILISAFSMGGDMNLFGLFVTLLSFVWAQYSSYRNVKPHQIHINLKNIIDTPYKRSLPILIPSFLASFLLTDGFIFDVTITFVVIFIAIKTVIEIKQTMAAPI